MKKQTRCRAAAAVAAAALLAGCAVPYSPAPIATNFPSTEQAKLQAAGHWTAIGSHIGQQLALALKNNVGHPLYVYPRQATPFGQAVAGQLMTSLVNEGYVVSKTADGALGVEIDTQVVAFSADRPQYRNAGERSALVAGLWVLTDIEPHTAAGMATAAIIGQDAYAWFHSKFASAATPKTEIIVTVAVSDQQRYYVRNTSVYYTTDNDRALYEAAPPAKVQLTKSFVVTGEAKK